MNRFRKWNRPEVGPAWPVILGLLWFALVFFMSYPTEGQKDEGREFGFSRLAEAAAMWAYANDAWPEWALAIIDASDAKIAEEAVEVFDEAMEDGNIPSGALPEWGTLFLILGDEENAKEALEAVDNSINVDSRQRRLVQRLLRENPAGEGLASWAEGRYEKGVSELPVWYFLLRSGHEEADEIESWIVERGNRMLRRGMVATATSGAVATAAIMAWILFLKRRLVLPSMPERRRFFRDWKFYRSMRTFFSAEVRTLALAFIGSIPLFAMGFYDAGLIYGGLAVQVLPVCFLVFSMTPGWDATKRLFGLSRPDWRFRELFWFGLIGTGIVLMIGWALSQFGTLSDSINDVISADYLDRPLPVIWIFIVAVIIAPFFEEVVIRGFLFSFLMTRFRPVPAAIISSAMFAFLHGYSLLGFVSTMSLGLVFSWLYWRSGSLWPGVFCHALFNLCVTTASVGWYSLH
ncbi:MAG: type II CAAX endopeptidase family protein [Verrucomicrobiota bacterium]